MRKFMENDALPARQVMFALVGILVVAAAVRLWDAGGPSMWVDELYSVSFSRVPTEMLWGEWMARETNPPLFYTILKTWSALFGESDFALRALSVFMGLATIAAVFALTRALHSSLAGLVAAALMSISSLQLYFSIEVRAYMFCALGAALAIWSIVELVDRWRASSSSIRDTWPWLALYATSTWFAFHCHTMLFLLPVLANLFVVWVFWYRTPRRLSDAVGWIVANALLALASAWWIGMTIQTMRSGAAPIEWIDPPTLKDAVAITSHLFSTRTLSVGNLVLGAALGPLALWGAWRLPLERRILMIVFAVGVPMLMLTISLVRPVFLERTIFWVQFVFIVCLATGLLELPWRRWRLAAGVIVGLIFVADSVLAHGEKYLEPWREIATVLRARAGSQDGVLLYNSDAGVNLDHYCRLQGCGDAAWLAPSGRPEVVLPEFFRGELVAPEDMGAHVQRYNQLWVLHREDQDPRPFMRDAMVLTEDNAISGDADARLVLSVWRKAGVD